MLPRSLFTYPHLQRTGRSRTPQSAGSMKAFLPDSPLTVFSLKALKYYCKMV